MSINVKRLNKQQEKLLRQFEARRRTNYTVYRNARPDYTRRKPNRNVAREDIIELLFLISFGLVMFIMIGSQV